MAPRPPAPQGVHIRVNWSGPNGARAANIFYVLDNFSPPFTVAHLSNVANFVAGGYTPSGVTQLMQSVSSAWTLTSIDASDATGATENQASVQPNLVGGSAGNALPPSIACCVGWSIPARYRGGKPRMYLPGVPESALAAPGEQVFASAYQANVESGANNLVAHVSSATVDGAQLAMGTFSFFTGKALRPIPVWRPFGVATVHRRIDSQRRRLGKESSFG